MNIFQRIKEVKLPFFAVIAALVFGGVVAPANAVGVAHSSITATPGSSNIVILYGLCQSLPGTLLASEFVLEKDENPIWTQKSITATISGPEITLTLASGTISGTDNYRLSYTGTSLTCASGSALDTFSNQPVDIDLTATSMPSAITGSTSLGSTISVATSAAWSNPSAVITKAWYKCLGGTISAAVASSRWSAESNGMMCSVVSGQTSNSLVLSALTFSASERVFYEEKAVLGSKTRYVNTAAINVTAATQGGGGGGGGGGAPTASNITVSSITNGGATITFNQSLYGSGQGCMAKLRLASSAAYSVAQVLDYTQSAIASSSWINSGSGAVTWSITGKTAGTNYAADIACTNQGANSQVYTTSFTTTGTAPSGGQGGNQQANASQRRPLPQISFATNPAPGFSVRPTSDTRKGTLTLKGENFSDLTAITIGGKKADFTVKDGKLEIKLPAGVTGFPEVVMTNGGGSITMQNAIEIVENKVQKLTRFVGDRFTKAGLETLENACIDNKDATSIEAIVVVASDATEADYANAVKAATDAATYLDKVSKRISHTSVTVVKTGAAGSKPTVEMNFTKQ